MIFTPVATYRIQFHKDFTFKDLLPQIPYLASLGIDTIYASPIFTARPGSTHGYDVTNANELNPELGTPEDFLELQEALKQHDLKWLQDIVPNHMAYHESNRWLMDVFEKGPQSEFFNFFDIDWQYPDPNYTGKVMAPFLGAPLEEVLSAGDIKLIFGETGFQVQFYENKFPVSLQTWPELMLLVTENGMEKELKTAFDKLKTSFDPYREEKITEGCLRVWDQRKEAFIKAVQGNEAWSQLVQKALEKLNANQEKLSEILNKQVYRLAYWKETDRQINYRRFFTINELICLRMELPEVFEAYHETTLEFVKKGYFQGLRIDHIDGLLDPVTYMNRLRDAAGPTVYLTIEKILEIGEEMPETWPVQGSTGYFFLAIVNQLFTRHSNAQRFDEIYTRFIGNKPDYEQMVFEKKLYMLENHMKGELNNLLHLMEARNLLPPAEDYPKKHIKDALKILLASYPVYRLYTNALPVIRQDARVLEYAFDEAVKYARYLKREFDFFYEMFQAFKEGLPGKPEDRLYFLMRTQQFTGPLAAKGVEDTTFYNYNRLISHNEVGDKPEAFGFKAEHFHKKLQNRSKVWPIAQNASATHDTKRGEDARMRLNVLSEMPDEWEAMLQTWETANRKFLTTLNGKQTPSQNRIYFLYQALLGAFPMNGEMETDFLDRVKEAMTKAMREAKRYSNWSDPNEKYEAGVHEFTEGIFKPNSEFTRTFLPFVKKLSFYGMLYSLGQVLIKIAAPGIPDIYQGCELWDLSMVDPDNRRPVPYEKTSQLLKDLSDEAENGKVPVAKSVMQNWEDGRIKLFTTWRTLNTRKAYKNLFTYGEYIPLETSFKDQAQVLAFARHADKEWSLVFIPLNVVTLTEPGVFPLGTTAWKDATVTLPENAPTRWKNQYTGEIISGENKLALAEVFASFPVALLIAE